jgi:acyl dehydratase
MAWWFEDFVVGRTLTSPERTVTEADVLAFAELTGDHHPLHTDAAFAAGTEFGQQIAHGLLGLGLAVGLLARGGLVGPAILALLGVRDWRFLAPVRLGEVIHAQATIAEARPSAGQPDRGIVTLGVELRRADAVVAQRGAVVLLVARQPGREAAPPGQEA